MCKKVLVTGAARGIGFDIVKLFSGKKYFVFANYNQHIGMLEENDENVVLVKADVSKLHDVKNMFNQIGNVDIVVNNAGIAQIKEFIDITEADWNKVIDTNLKSAFLCCKEFIGGMINKKEGCIVNISSMWGVAGGSCEVHYSASKAGLIGLTKSLAKEFGASGVRVNCVAPGVIDTSMNNDLSDDDKNFIIDRTPLRGIGNVRHVSEAVLFLVENQFITGEVLNVNGGFVM